MQCRESTSKDSRPSRSRREPSAQREAKGSDALAGLKSSNALEVRERRPGWIKVRKEIPWLAGGA